MEISITGNSVNALCVMNTMKMILKPTCHIVGAADVN